MSEMTTARIEDHFVDLTDPRNREVTYPLMNVVTLPCAPSSVEQMISWPSPSRPHEEGLAGTVSRSEQRHSVARSVQCHLGSDQAGGV